MEFISSKDTLDYKTEAISSNILDRSDTFAFNPIVAVSSCLDARVVINDFISFIDSLWTWIRSAKARNVS